MAGVPKQIMLESLVIPMRHAKLLLSNRAHLSYALLSILDYGIVFLCEQQLLFCYSLTLLCDLGGNRHRCFH